MRRQRASTRGYPNRTRFWTAFEPALVLAPPRETRTLIRTAAKMSESRRLPGLSVRGELPLQVGFEPSCGGLRPAILSRRPSRSSRSGKNSNLDCPGRLDIELRTRSETAQIGRRTGCGLTVEESAAGSTPCPCSAVGGQLRSELSPDSGRASASSARNIDQRSSLQR